MLVYGALRSDAGAPTMSFADAYSEGTIEECLEEFDTFVLALTCYSPATLAVALRIHLGALLQALLLEQLCTREEVRDFLRDMQRDAAQYED
jgi:hypothetical protein